MKESKMYRERLVSGQDPENSVVKEGDNWKLRLSDGTEMILPERLGKSMYVALDLMTKHTKRKRTFHYAWPWKNATEAYLRRFDCHALVAIGIGALTNLKLLEYLSYTANHKFFSDGDFKFCDSLGEFTQRATPLLTGDPPIAVFQQKEDGYLSHSFFLFKGKSNLYMFFRGGKLGGLSFERLDDATWRRLVKTYGDEFAGDSYGNIAAREDLKAYYAESHSDA